MFIDVHCHIDLLKDPKKVVDDFSKKGVGIAVSNGVDPENNRKVLELSERFKEIKPALGIYPDEGVLLREEEIQDEIEFIRNLKDKVVAIGEIGMDFKGNSDRIKQEEIFRKLVLLGEELKKPLIIHSRKAEREVIEILESLGSKKVIMHCFSGNFNLVSRIAKNGWSFSIPANVVFSEHFQKIVSEVPITQLFCETDSPFLSPEKKFPNNPGNVIESYKKIAEIKGLSLKEVESKIFENYKKNFL